MRKLYFDPSSRVDGLSRNDEGVRAALALCAQYSGEQTIAIGLSGLVAVRAGAVSKLIREAARLLDPWGEDARIELRCLRPSVRRTLVEWLPAESQVMLVSARRRVLVLAPGNADEARVEAVLAGLGSNRRKMFLLALRDGEQCVWCSTPLTHRSAQATVDHILCRSEGGGDALDNLVLACAPCNHRRSNAPARLWLDLCLAGDAAVDVDTVVSAIVRAERHHRRRPVLEPLPAAA